MKRERHYGCYPYVTITRPYTPGLSGAGPERAVQHSPVVTTLCNTINYISHSTGYYSLIYICAHFYNILNFMNRPIGLQTFQNLYTCGNLYFTHANFFLKNYKMDFCANLDCRCAKLDCRCAKFIFAVAVSTFERLGLLSYVNNGTGGFQHVGF